MRNPLRWYDHLSLNIYWLGINIASGSITPVILPFLVVLFVPASQKNTYLATIRVIGLAVAMLIQPMAGMLSDRSTLRWGRRRPFIFTGALLNILFLAVVGASPLFLGFSLDGFFQPTFGVNTAYAVLLLGIVLL
jgi:MFS family permease